MNRPTVRLIATFILAFALGASTGCVPSTDVAGTVVKNQDSTAGSASQETTQEAEALRWVRAGSFPATASVAIARDDSRWLVAKSSGAYFVVRVVEGSRTADFIFPKDLLKKGPSHLGGIALRSGEGNVRVFDRLSNIPPGADLALVLKSLEGSAAVAP